MANGNGNGQCVLGMIGLGVMGRNLLLNMADNKYTVAGYDKDIQKVESLKKEGNHKSVYAASNVKEFINSLKKPRTLMLLVPAGKPVDSVIEEFTPHLDKEDLIIDAGNSHYTDTDVRAKKLKEKGIHFFGMGVSGGEEGARHGPSMMPGGPKEAYERVKKLLEDASAHVEGEPCVTYLGAGSAGHFVKMVHNGIEYGIMQMISETYDLLKRGFGYSNTQLHELYTQWNKEELNSFLVEITSNIFAQKDENSKTELIDKILDVAKQKGTGQWTSQAAMELQVPTPTIDFAVTMRDLSMYTDDRKKAHEIYNREIHTIKVEDKTFKLQLKSALFTGMIAAYTQGMALLSVATQKYNYGLDLEAVARIWRGGCIIRSKLLEDIRNAYKTSAKLTNLLLDQKFAQLIQSNIIGLRKIVGYASAVGVPTPCLMASLSYIDAFTSGWLPANLIQAQRDCFGAHTYERIDKQGVFHTEWGKG